MNLKISDFDCRRVSDTVLVRGGNLSKNMVRDGIVEFVYYANAGLLCSEWSQDAPVTPNPYGLTLDPAEEACIRMLLHVGSTKINHRRRYIARLDEGSPLGPGNAVWCTTRSHDARAEVARKQRARRRWQCLATEDKEFFRVWPSFEAFDDSIPFPPGGRVSIAKKDGALPWSRENAQWVSAPNIWTDASLIRKRQRAYRAWRYTAVGWGFWDSFDAFVQAVGLPPAEGRWSIGLKEESGPFAPENVTWVDRSASAGEMRRLDHLRMEKAPTTAPRAPAKEPAATAPRAPTTAPTIASVNVNAPKAQPTSCACGRGNVVTDPPVGVCLHCVIEKAKDAGRAEATYPSARPEFVDFVGLGRHLSAIDLSRLEVGQDPLPWEDIGRRAVDYIERAAPSAKEPT